MLVFPIQSLLSYQNCYDLLLLILHPKGLHCRCGECLKEGQKPHKYNATGLPSYRCRCCGSVFNIFTDTVLQGVRYDCITIILMLRGFAQGKTTLHLSKELNRNYKNLLNWRHILQELSYENRSIMRLEDEVIESDEVFINAGEKGEKHSDPKDPPRIRANKKKGTGTYENDRPPVQGLFGRESKQIRLAVCLGARIAQIQPIIEQLTPEGCRLNTDESNAYNRVKDTPREHQTVNHSKREFARDDDGDGVYEVHCNSTEGLWTGVRNFLRPFRGVHKRYLAQYVVIFENSFNFKQHFIDIIRAMLIPDYYLEYYASP